MWCKLFRIVAKEIRIRSKVTANTRENIYYSDRDQLILLHSQKSYEALQVKHLYTNTFVLKKTPNFGNIVL